MVGRSISYFLGISLFIFSACGKEPVPAPAPVGWTALSAISFPVPMNKTRMGSVCLQLQSRSAASSKELRIAVAKSTCPAASTQLLPEEQIAFSLTPSQTEDGVYLAKNGTLVGMAASLDGTFHLKHFCQFSDSTVTPNPYFQRVCEIQFLPDGTLSGILLKPLEGVIGAYNEDQQYLVALSVRLEAERKELQEQVKRLRERIRLLEGHAETDAFLEEVEQKMDALRTELKLGADATPEQIGAAVARQGVLISQFSREITELKKALDLPKNATFDDVLKAMRASRAKADPPDASAATERKEPAKSPINN